MSEKPPHNVVDLSTSTRRKKARSKIHKANAKSTTLCGRGFHKWVDDPKKQFDVQAGKLVSIRRCSRCGVSKTQVG